MGLGQRIGRDYEEEVPHTCVGPTPEHRGKIEASADASGASHRLLSPFQEKRLAKTDRQRSGQGKAQWPGCVARAHILRNRLEGREPGIHGTGHALRALFCLQPVENDSELNRRHNRPPR
jgi:hypothetical protein